ncbi:unnamed protein product [Microthlaspi erraticum]|uniref:DUF4283 domain-containing protein n=1 Tax=Microthlaspi erraticum TaxID=1685480 RepID=A0A6D2J4Y6_9BRAS|nr:unnamed protein product [Microthlaspi erraticum]
MWKFQIRITTRNKDFNQAPFLKGAWTKKLDFSLSSTSQQAPQNSREVQGMWHALCASKTSRKHGEYHASQKPLAMEDDIRFPWPAKMNTESRNLYRASEPEYVDDGTPKVTIPQHVLLQGLENHKEYILGQFYHCYTLAGGLIHVVFIKIWGRNCKITIRKLGESNYLFHIPDDSTRIWVLQRGLWHVDNCMMFVAAWTLEASLAIQEIKTIPVWVTLKKLPNIMYSIPGISHIASGLGAVVATHKPRWDLILMGEAKILVEVELSKAFPPRITDSDKTGFISMVVVEYAWLPSQCRRFRQLGHKVKHYLQAESGSHQLPANSAPAPSIKVLPCKSSVVINPIIPNVEDTSRPDIASDSEIAADSEVPATQASLESPLLETAHTTEIPAVKAFSTIPKCLESPLSEPVQSISVNAPTTAHTDSTL